MNVICHLVSIDGAPRKRKREEDLNDVASDSVAHPLLTHHPIYHGLWSYLSHALRQAWGGGGAEDASSEGEGAALHPYNCAVRVRVALEALSKGALQDATLWRWVRQEVAVLPPTGWAVAAAQQALWTEEAAALDGWDQRRRIAEGTDVPHHSVSGDSPSAETANAAAEVAFQEWCDHADLHDHRQTPLLVDCMRTTSNVEESQRCPWASGERPKQSSAAEALARQLLLPDIGDGQPLLPLRLLPPLLFFLVMVRAVRRREKMLETCLVPRGASEATFPSPLRTVVFAAAGSELHRLGSGLLPDGFEESVHASYTQSLLPPLVQETATDSHGLVARDGSHAATLSPLDVQSVVALRREPQYEATSVLLAMLWAASLHEHAVAIEQSSAPTHSTVPTELATPLALVLVSLEANPQVLRSYLWSPPDCGSVRAAQVQENKSGSDMWVAAQQRWTALTVCLAVGEGIASQVVRSLLEPVEEGLLGGVARRTLPRADTAADFTSHPPAMETAELSFAVPFFVPSLWDLVATADVTPTPPPPVPSSTAPRPFACPPAAAVHTSVTMLSSQATMTAVALRHPRALLLQLERVQHLLWALTPFQTAAVDTDGCMEELHRRLGQLFAVYLCSRRCCHRQPSPMRASKETPRTVGYDPTAPLLLRLGARPALPTAEPAMTPPERLTAAAAMWQSSAAEEATVSASALGTRVTKALRQFATVLYQDPAVCYFLHPASSTLLQPKQTSASEPATPSSHPSGGRLALKRPAGVLSLASPPYARAIAALPPAAAHDSQEVTSTLLEVVGAVIGFLLYDVLRSCLVVLESRTSSVLSELGPRGVDDRDAAAAVAVLRHVADTMRPLIKLCPPPARAAWHPYQPLAAVLLPDVLRVYRLIVPAQEVSQLTEVLAKGKLLQA